MVRAEVEAPEARTCEAAGACAETDARTSRALEVPQELLQLQHVLVTQVGVALGVRWPVRVVAGLCHSREVVPPRSMRRRKPRVQRKLLLLR